MDKKPIIITDLKGAKAIRVHVVYGIQGKLDNKIVYIGQTSKLYQRFEHYLYCPKNKRLAVWLKENEWQLIILEENPAKPLEAEKLWIEKAGKHNLFNLVHGAEENWLHESRAPWIGKQGVKCPSDIMLLYLKNRKHEGYDNIKQFVSEKRKQMTDANRILFETSLAIDFYEWGGGRFKKFFDKWRDTVRNRAIKCLENPA